MLKRPPAYLVGVLGGLIFLVGLNVIPYRLAPQIFEELRRPYFSSHCPHKVRWKPPSSKVRPRAQLCNADLAGAQLIGANLTGANLVLANLSGAWLANANLSHADLRYATLRNATLHGADLSGAKLEGANLSGNLVGATLYPGVDLSGANLNGADLSYAKLGYANFFGADLKNADLSNADLSGTDLIIANLSGANLTEANLSGAMLSGTDLGKAKLCFADLTNTLYEPASAELDPYVGGIRGLTTVRVRGEPYGLVRLRKLLADGGFRDEERQATYSIERARTEGYLHYGNLIERIRGTLRFVAFDVPVAYGNDPARALLLILGIAAFLTFVYMQPIRHPRKELWKPSGLYRVFPARRIDKTPSTQTVDKERVEAGNYWKAFWLAAYFSLISAVNIGFQQFTPGDWIRRLQTREYSLEPVGWVRVVAGAQALLSVYLLAIWVLTQFGRPFD
jgi:uncharacterized protein YjbI with pentapeptide repeats